MRFSKRVKVFPGFYLNVSKSGLSATVGGKGASINFSKRGTYRNTNVPGLGVSNRQKIGGKNAEPKNSLEASKQTSNVIEREYVQEIKGEIKSADISELTSSSLTELKESLLEAYQDRIEISNELILVKKELLSAKRNRVIARVFLIGFFIKSFKIRILEKEQYLLDLEQQLKNCFVNIDVNFDVIFEETYLSLVESYKSLISSEFIWDITASVQQDTKITRSAASTIVTRQPVKFRFENIDIVKSTYPAFHFENKNGGDLFVYPTFVIVTNANKELGLIDFKDFQMKFASTRFLEREKIPSDSQIVGETWDKVNKNGQPDKRFKDNFKIPIVAYGEIELSSISGLNEVYSFSSLEKSNFFVKEFERYKKIIE